jgi:hypothetical protein
VQGEVLSIGDAEEMPTANDGEAPMQMAVEEEAAVGGHETDENSMAPMTEEGAAPTCVATIATPPSTLEAILDDPHRSLPPTPPHPPPLPTVSPAAVAAAAAAAVASASPQAAPSVTSRDLGGISQLCYARVLRDDYVLDSSVSAMERHPGDVTPRLLLIRGTSIGDHTKGRLLLSPWSCFNSVFPMHGTYFAQNEVFEDEDAGEVTVPLSALGAERHVYIGKSIEGVLRYRSAAELTILFRHSHVCIRRYRSSDQRLLPLILDAPRLLKHKALPSGLAVQLGLVQPVAQSAQSPAQQAHQQGSPVVAKLVARAIAEVLSSVACGARVGGVGGTVAAGGLDLPDAGGATAHGGDSRMATDPPTAPPPPSLFGEAVAADGSVADGCTTAAVSTPITGPTTQLRMGLRLFSLYVAAGGALCMRQTVWRRLMLILHPDKGGDVAVFQTLSDLKRRLDAGERLTDLHLPPSAFGGGGSGSGSTDDGSAEEVLYSRVRAELQTAAKEVGDAAAQQLAGL